MNSKKFDPEALKRATSIIEQLPNSNPNAFPEQSLVPAQENNKASPPGELNPLPKPSEYLTGISNFGPPGQGKSKSIIASAKAMFSRAPEPKFGGLTELLLEALETPMPNPIGGIPLLPRNTIATTKVNSNTENEQDILDVDQVFEHLKKHVDNPNFTTGNLAAQMNAVYASKPPEQKSFGGIDESVALDALATILDDPTFYRAIAKSDGSTHRLDFSRFMNPDSGHRELFESIVLIANVNAAKKDPAALLNLVDSRGMVGMPSTQIYSESERVERMLADSPAQWDPAGSKFDKSFLSNVNTSSKFQVYGQEHTVFGVLSKIKKSKTYSDAAFNDALDLYTHKQLPVICNATLAIAALGSSEDLEFFKKEHVAQFARQFSTATYEACSSASSTQRVNFLRLLLDTQSEHKPIEIPASFYDSRTLDTGPLWENHGKTPASKVNVYCREQKDTTQKVLSFLYTPAQIESMFSSNSSVSILNGAKSSVFLLNDIPTPVVGMRDGFAPDNTSKPFGV